MFGEMRASATEGNVVARDGQDVRADMFQVSGDSMNPIPDKSWVIGEYLENWFDIKDGQAYIILTLDDGIVFKLVNNHLRKKRTLELVSLNDE